MACVREKKCLSPFVSVLMPVYQAEETVAEAAGSILGGTLKELELIAVDDGSTDRTPEILHDAARCDERMRVISTPHRGITAALTTALKAARAPLVGRMDADDISSPERIVCQAAALEAHPGWAGVGCCFRWFAASSPTPGMERYAAWQNSLITPGDIRRAMFIENPVTHATLLVRREVLEQVGGYVSRDWSEDYDLVLRLLLAGHELGKVPEVLYQWRESGSRLTRTAEHCSAENFHRTRVHYLHQHVLAGRTHVALWGVGRQGAAWKRSLDADGLDVAFHSINPRAMKVSIGGRTTIPPDRLPAVPPGLLTLIACGTRENRDLLRRAATLSGLAEGHTFWCVG